MEWFYWGIWITCTSTWYMHWRLFWIRWRQKVSVSSMPGCGQECSDHGVRAECGGGFSEACASWMELDQVEKYNILYIITFQIYYSVLCILPRMSCKVKWQVFLLVLGLVADLGKFCLNSFIAEVGTSLLNCSPLSRHLRVQFLQFA
jgi:hypothetical protein